MVTRRAFMTTVGAMPLVGLARPAFASSQNDITTPLNAPVGLQLWSVRNYLAKNFTGTLGKVRAMGFQEVESAGFFDRSPTKFRAALEQAGLRCQSCHVGFPQLRDRPADTIDEIRAVGATWVVCPWINHSGAFTYGDARMAADVLNHAGRMAKDMGVNVAYHCHGYEFVPSVEGTLFDTLVGATEPEFVSFQIDVQHALLGGADPAALITRYATRVKMLHLKDVKVGVPIRPGQDAAPPDADVPVGTGQVDMPAVLRAAKKAGVALYYIEDESPDPMGHIPQSIRYLEHVML